MCGASQCAPGKLPKKQASPAFTCFSRDLPERQVKLASRATSQAHVRSRRTLQKLTGGFDLGNTNIEANVAGTYSRSKGRPERKELRQISKRRLQIFGPIVSNTQNSIINLREKRAGKNIFVDEHRLLSGFVVVCSRL